MHMRTRDCSSNPHGDAKKTGTMTTSTALVNFETWSQTPYKLTPSLASSYAIPFTLNKRKEHSHMHKKFEQNKKIKLYSFYFEQKRKS